MMHIAVIHTAASPCGCAEAISAGLKHLGHTVLLVDSEEIAFAAGEIARTCDLVIDHTDTFHGSGIFRPFVRQLLEACGARIVGSGAQACAISDNKAAAKQILANAGIAVPPGFVASCRNQALPGWLRPPVVLKPVYEHMSRGLCVAATDDEIRSGIAGLLDKYRQPIIAETFIRGRELAVSLIEGETDLRMLPPVEVVSQSGEYSIQDEAFKLTDVTAPRQDLAPVQLPPDLAEELERLSIHSFRSLGLRDYARFDIRLSPGGTFYFLEANTTPSMEPYEALAFSAKLAGMDYTALVQAMLAAAIKRYASPKYTRKEKVTITLPTGPVDITVPSGVHHPPSSSIELAGLIDVKQGERILDLGCGTGLLAIASAKLDAGKVVAVDIAPLALEATAANARANGVADRIMIRPGSWFETLDGHVAHSEHQFDMIVATPPQTPGHQPIGNRYGGRDGTNHLLSIIEHATYFLEPQRGRLWLLVISLANHGKIFHRLHDLFCDVRIIHETQRVFTEAEYESIHKGLMKHFLDLRSTGQADFQETANGDYIFRNFFIRAQGVRQK